MVVVDVMEVVGQESPAIREDAALIIIGVIEEDIMAVFKIWNTVFVVY